MANQKRMPGFLLALYGSYSIQWAMFIILSVTFSVLLYSNFHSLKELLDLQKFSVGFFLPASFFSLSGNYVSFYNSAIIPSSAASTAAKTFYFQNI